MRTPLRQGKTLAPQRPVPMQFHQLPEHANKTPRPEEWARRRSQLHSRYNRLKRSTRASVHSPSHSRFNQLLSTRTIGLKEANTGRAPNTRNLVRIIRGGTLRVGTFGITPTA